MSDPYRPKTAADFIECKKKLLESLTITNGHACQYTPSGEKLASYCDCKFGGPVTLLKDSACISEQTGCPELRLVRDILERMTVVDLRRILARQ